MIEKNFVRHFDMVKDCMSAMSARLVKILLSFATFSLVNTFVAKIVNEPLANSIRRFSKGKQTFCSVLPAPRSGEFSNEIYNNQNSASVVELWLDLRGMTIPPRALLDFLIKDIQIWQETKSQKEMKVNRILLGDQGVQCNKNFGEHLYELKDMVDWVMQVKERDTASKAQYYDTTCEMAPPYHGSVSPGDVAAQLVRLEIDGRFSQLVDPFLGMKCISKGDWVIIDTGKPGNDDSARFSALQGLVDLLIASASNSRFDLVFGSFSPNSVVSLASKEGRMGGIAITCSCIQDLFSFAPLLKQVTSGNYNLRSTESGIFVRDNQTDLAKARHELKAGLVLPLEPELWRNVPMFLE